MPLGLGKGVGVVTGRDTPEAEAMGGEGSSERNVEEESRGEVTGVLLRAGGVESVTIVGAGLDMGRRGAKLLRCERVSCQTV
jgi:CBS domain-containing protein